MWEKAYFHCSNSVDFPLSLNRKFYQIRLEANHWGGGRGKDIFFEFIHLKSQVYLFLLVYIQQVHTPALYVWALQESDRSFQQVVHSKSVVLFFPVHTHTLLHCNEVITSKEKQLLQTHYTKGWWRQGGKKSVKQMHEKPPGKEIQRSILSNCQQPSNNQQSSWSKKQNTEKSQNTKKRKAAAFEHLQFLFCKISKTSKACQVSSHGTAYLSVF